MNLTYKALQVTEAGGQYLTNIVTLNTADLPKADVIIKVDYSSVNYKDALSASGNKGVTRSYPHVPGVDAAGTVISSNAAGINTGDKVLVTGFDLGMNTPGGFGQYISVPAGWVVPLPPHMTAEEAMSLGTAGLTAALSVQQLLLCGIRPEDGPVVVTGAGGGVGSIAIAILSKLGYSVTAVTGKPDTKFFKDLLGATEIISREQFTVQLDKKPLSSPLFAGGIDTVGGSILSALLKSIKYGATVTCCGMVASADVNTSIFPFILRGIKLAGIDSVELPLHARLPIWNKLADEWKPLQLGQFTRIIGIEELPEELDRARNGNARGRVLVQHAH